jgi:polyisoprenoid-binding protein YceI
MKTLLLVPFLFPLLVSPSTPPSAATPRGDNDWVVDPVHSSVVFRVKHVNTSWFMGTFDVIEGTVTIDASKPETGSVQLKIPVASVDTNNKNRDGHLQNNDFFNSKENPDITFKSSKIAKKDKMLEVTGELAMAGKKKEITIPVEFVGEGEMQGKRVGYSTTFTIKGGTDFGMPGFKKGLGDEVTLIVNLELNQPKK